MNTGRQQPVFTACSPLYRLFPAEPYTRRQDNAMVGALWRNGGAISCYLYSAYFRR